MQHPNITLDIPKHKVSPLIEMLNTFSLPYPYYSSFLEAKRALDDEEIQKHLKKAAQKAYNLGGYNRRIVLLETEEEVYLQGYNALLDILKERGFTCENFEDPNFNVAAWLQKVFINRSKDELRRKVPKAQRESLEPTDDGYNAFISKFSTQDIDLLEDAEITRLQNWFSNIASLVLKYYPSVLNIYKTVIHKLIYAPETISLTELQNLCSKNPDIRPARQALRIIQQEYLPCIDAIESCGNMKSYMTKDWAVYILFGAKYSSFPAMCQQMPVDEFKKLRENNIRRTLNRADSDLWMVITKLLLWIAPKEGYKSIYANMLLSALQKAKLNLPPSKKDNFANTEKEILQWVDAHVHENVVTSFRYVKTALGVLHVDNATQTLQHGLSEKQYDALMVEMRNLHKLAIQLCASNIPLMAK